MKSSPLILFLISIILFSSFAFTLQKHRHQLRKSHHKFVHSEEITKEDIEQRKNDEHNKIQSVEAEHIEKKSPESKKETKSEIEKIKNEFSSKAQRQSNTTETTNNTSITIHVSNLTITTTNTTSTVISTNSSESNNNSTIIIFSLANSSIIIFIIHKSMKKI